MQIHQTLSAQELRDLLLKSQQPCLTLTFPTESAGSEVRQNRIRYKNLSSDLAQQISDRSWLQQLYELERDQELWQSQESGFILLSTPENIQIWQVPYTVPEYLFVGRRFHVRSLWPLLNETGSYLLLKLNLNRIELLLGSRFEQPTEIPLPAGADNSLSEYMEKFSTTNELRFHTLPGSGAGGGKGTALFHGHGDVTTEQKTLIRGFFDQLVPEMSPLLKEYQLPIVLVGVEYLLPLFQEAVQSLNLTLVGISQQPDTMSEKELREQAWNLVSPLYRQEEVQERTSVEEKQNSSFVTPFLTDIVPLAREGRVKSLFVSKSASSWGSFDEDRNEVRPHTERGPNSEQLWELAIQYTFLTKGKVFIIEDSDPLLGTEQGKALLRY